jgi:hypothetical protein
MHIKRRIVVFLGVMSQTSYQKAARRKENAETSREIPACV